MKYHKIVILRIENNLAENNQKEKNMERFRTFFGMTAQRGDKGVLQICHSEVVLT